MPNSKFNPNAQLRFYINAGLVALAIILLIIPVSAQANHGGKSHQLPLIVSRPVGANSVSQPVGGNRADPGLRELYLDDPCRLVDNYSWPKRTAFAICMAESSGRVKAINWRDYPPTSKCRGSFGLMQIGCLWVKKLAGIGHQNDLLDGPANVRAAHDLWLKSGKSFKHWSAYKNGSYKRFLNEY